MSYAQMDHAGWLERNLKMTLTPFQKKVADIIGMVGGGIYNAPVSWKTAEFHPKYVRIVWREELATYDFNGLTALVFLAHAARIRVSVQGCGPRYTEILFHPRTHDGGMCKKHPDIDEAVAAFRAYLPDCHRVNYHVAEGPGV